MATNDFLAFAGASGANVLSQSDYAALTALIGSGFQSGTAQSAQINKVFRQSSIMSAVLAQFIVDLTGKNATDDGTTATLLANLKAAVSANAGMLGGASYRLSNTSGTLVLRPYGGNVLMIPGIGPVTIPAAGVSLAAAGLTAGTTYFIYATVTGGNLTLEASTTGHSTDANTGIEIKTGDATRVLVGMERASTATAWLGLCRSWRNDPGFSATAVLTSSNGTSSTAYAELNPVIRTGFLLWANEKPTFSASGGVITTAANVSVWTAFAVDSATAPIDGVSVTTPQSGNVYPAAFSLAASPSGLAEGYHYLTMLVKVGTSTASWVGDTNVGSRSSITVSLPPHS